MNAAARLLQAWRAWCIRPRPLGSAGEAAAARYLRRQGLRIVARGYRDPLGEIDLVAVEGRTVVFVEVKTRTDHLAGHPAEAVDRQKQRRLTRAALGFLRRHHLLDYPARFDVVAVTWPPGQRMPAVQHIRDAFPAAGDGGMYG